jgi:hypothetical protein
MGRTSLRTLKIPYLPLILGLCLSISVIICLLLWEGHILRHSESRVYLQGWPSELLQHTVTLVALRDEPFTSLWNLHIQPPALDTIRAILANLVTASNPVELLHKVDSAMYVIWALIYGAFIFLIYWWLLQASNLFIALIGAFIFALHPAGLLYATLLDGTILSSFLIAVFVYLLWKIKQHQVVSPLILSLSFLSLFFTRAIFQWPMLLVVIFSLVLLRYPHRKLLRFSLITSAVVFLYLAKQYALFGITTTSSFAGLNFCKSIAACQTHPLTVLSDDAIKALPIVLGKPKKLDQSINLNDLPHLQLHQELMQDYLEKIKTTPLSELVKYYVINLNIYLKPSSFYAEDNRVVLSLPKYWRETYDEIFSYPWLSNMLFLSLLLWLVNYKKGALLPSIGLAIPIVAIFAISILFENFENMRFKFFIEAPVYIFIITQWNGLYQLLFQKFFPRKAVAPS